MTHSRDIDLTRPAAPSTEGAAAPDLPEPEAPEVSHGSAQSLTFQIWDGRTVEMRRIGVTLSQQINMAAFDAEPLNPVKANQIGRIGCIKASLVRVGDKRVGVAGETSESLYVALSDLGLQHAMAAWNMMNVTTDEQDAAFLGSIVAR